MFVVVGVDPLKLEVAVSDGASGAADDGAHVCLGEAEPRGYLLHRPLAGVAQTQYLSVALAQVGIHQPADFAKQSFGMAFAVAIRCVIGRFGDDAGFISASDDPAPQQVDACIAH